MLINLELSRILFAKNTPYKSGHEQAREKRIYNSYRQRANESFQAELVKHFQV